MKPKLIFFLILNFTFLFASQLIVKNADVKLIINGQEFVVPEDQNLSMKPGTMVCFVDGNGTAMIDFKIKLNSKNPDCYQVPLDENTDVKKLLSSIEKDAVISSVKISSTASSRGIDDLKVDTGTISLPSSKKEVVIYNESYGPLPVTLSIKKSDGTVIKKMINEDSDKTLFRIPASYLDNDSKIEVTNAFGDKLIDKKVSLSSTFKTKKHSKIFYEKKKHTIVDVLFGTDRKRNAVKSSWEKYYTGERSKLKYGVAEVSIPKIHVLGSMERPGLFSHETIGRHVMITKLEDINDKKFLAFLKIKLDNVEKKDILIFIHGFNVTFADAIRRTAQISYDLKFKGVPMAYSWPSKGKVNQYMSDEASVQYTVPHLVKFLSNIIQNKGDAKIHIIAHSMGTRALTNALKDIFYIYKGKHVFKNIILAAPDIDKDVFKESLLPYITSTTDKVTLYASSKDSALKASNTLHSGERIGQSGDDVLFVYDGDGFDTIDASEIDTSLIGLGHSYFAEKEILMTDIKEVIIKSLPPTKRESLIEELKAKLAYWKFKIFNR